MTRVTRILLALAVINLPLGVLFLTGVVGVASAPGLYVTLPAGAIFFGLFLIFRIMEREVAAFDAEQRKHQTPGMQASQGELHYDCACQSPGRA